MANAIEGPATLKDATGAAAISAPLKEVSVSSYALWLLAKLGKASALLRTGRGGNDFLCACLLCADEHNPNTCGRPELDETTVLQAKQIVEVK